MTLRYFRLLLLCLVLGLQAVTPFIHAHAAPLAIDHAGFLHLHQDTGSSRDPAHAASAGTQHVEIGVPHGRAPDHAPRVPTLAATAFRAEADARPALSAAVRSPPRLARAPRLLPPVLAPPLR